MEVDQEEGEILESDEERPSPSLEYSKTNPAAVVDRGVSHHRCSFSTDKNNIVLLHSAAYDDKITSNIKEPQHFLPTTTMYTTPISHFPVPILSSTSTASISATSSVITGSLALTGRINPFKKLPDDSDSEYSADENENSSSDSDEDFLKSNSKKRPRYGYYNDDDPNPLISIINSGDNNNNNNNGNNSSSNNNNNNNNGNNSSSSNNKNNNNALVNNYNHYYYRNDDGTNSNPTKKMTPTTSSNNPFNNPSINPSNNPFNNPSSSSFVHLNPDPVDAAKRRSKLNIWSSVVQDQLLSSDLSSWSGVGQKLTMDRSVESYDYEKAAELYRNGGNWRSYDRDGRIIGEKKYDGGDDEDDDDGGGEKGDATVVQEDLETFGTGAKKKTEIPSSKYNNEDDDDDYYYDDERRRRYSLRDYYNDDDDNDSHSNNNNKNKDGDLRNRNNNKNNNNNDINNRCDYKNWRRSDGKKRNYHGEMKSPKKRDRNSNRVKQRLGNRTDRLEDADDDIDGDDRKMKEKPVNKQLLVYEIDLKKDDSPRSVARELLKLLGEPEHMRQTFYAIVDTIGIERSLEILKKTKLIEENGGLMIQMGHRRRTPGGVYLYSLKGLTTPEEQKVIFKDRQQNQKAFYQRKKEEAAKQRKMKTGESRENSVDRIKTLNREDLMNTVAGVKYNTMDNDPGGEDIPEESSRHHLPGNGECWFKTVANEMGIDVENQVDRSSCHDRPGNGECGYKTAAKKGTGILAGNREATRSSVERGVIIRSKTIGGREEISSSDLRDRLIDREAAGLREQLLLSSSVVASVEQKTNVPPLRSSSSSSTSYHCASSSDLRDKLEAKKSLKKKKNECGLDLGGDGISEICDDDGDDDFVGRRGREENEGNEGENDFMEELLPESDSIELDFG